MGDNELIGTIIVIGIPLLGGVLALIKPVINLTRSITALDITMKQVVERNGVLEAEVKEHGETLTDHEKRLYLMEHKEHNRGKNYE